MNTLRRFLSTPEGMAGGLILLVLLMIALLAPFLFPQNPLAISGAPLLPPFEDWAHPLGTDRLGRDVFVGIVYGARSSLTVALASAAMSILVGSVVGTVSGFAGGIVDETIMRIADAFQTVPGFLLALTFVSVVGPSLGVIVAAIALSAWTGPARIARAEVLSIRERDYVASARVIGMRPAEIAFREILPNALPPVLALSAVIVAAAILTEAALSFLGLGDPNRVSWGGMIAEGRQYVNQAWWLMALPIVCVIVAVLGMNALGDGLREALDPVERR